MLKVKIGEKLNSSIPTTGAAMTARDRDAILRLIEAQATAGADYLDINTAVCGASELETMLWVISLAEQYSDCGIMLDSPSAATISEAVRHMHCRNIILNSVTVTERIDTLLPLALESGAGIVGLPIDSAGIPPTAAGRLRCAATLIARFQNAGIPPERIYIDALVEAVSVHTGNARITLETVRLLTEAYPNVRSLCGISNISFGLPQRALLNGTFLSMAIFCGLQSAILDLTSPAIPSAVQAANTLCGDDEFCMAYLAFLRGE